MSEIKGVELAERLPEPVEGRVYRIENVEYVRTPVQGLEGWRVTLVDVKDGAIHATVLWKRERVGASSKLGCFLKAFQTFFNDKEKVHNIGLWVGNLIEIVAWKAKNREIRVVGAVLPHESVEACMEAIIGKLEPGKAYTLQQIKALGVAYPENIIEAALQKITETGKAFTLPTKPVKWFIEG